MSTSLAGLTVIVARDDAPDDDISRAIAAAGAHVVPLRLMRVEPFTDNATRAHVEAGVAAADVVAVTSRHAAAGLAGHAPRPGAIVAAVGEATAAGLRAHGWPVDVVGDRGGAALARILGARVRGRTVFLPRAEGAHAALAQALRAAGATVDAVDVYRSVEVIDDADLDAVMGVPRPVALLLTSPRRVELLSARRRVPDDVLVVAIGDTTAAACAQAGLQVRATASRPAPDPVCAALARLHTPR